MEFAYEIYDEAKKRWLQGQFSAGEIRKKLGISGNICERAKANTLVLNRYRIVIAKQKIPKKDLFAAEWDEARMKLLRAGGKM